MPRQHGIREHSSKNDGACWTAGTAGKDFCPVLNDYVDNPTPRNLNRAVNSFAGLSDREVFVIDTLDLGDPHHDKALRSHIGTHPDILAGLVRNDWTAKRLGFWRTVVETDTGAWPWVGWSHVPWSTWRSAAA